MNAPQPPYCCYDPSFTFPLQPLLNVAQRLEWYTTLRLLPASFSSLTITPPFTTCLYPIPSCHLFATAGTLCFLSAQPSSVEQRAINSKLCICASLHVSSVACVSDLHSWMCHSTCFICSMCVRSSVLDVQASCIPS